MAERLHSIDLPYGDGVITVELPAHAQVDVYQPNDVAGVADAGAEVRRAMREPIGTAPLAVLARGKQRVAIVIDDQTRPVPTAAMLRPILVDLAEGGIDSRQVTVVIATGLHRRVSEAEARQLIGGLPLKAICHDPDDPRQLASIGTTSQGAGLLINRTVVDADLRILTGDIELHQFVGYGGGAKSVMPGVSDAASVRRTHSKMEAPGTGAGLFDGNPVRAEVEESADMLGVHFIVNVVLNSRHEVVRAFAGDVHQAFRAGTRLVDEIYKVAVPQPYDAVLASPGGFPKDIELYQSQKAITSARRIVRRGGMIIACAECREGHGSAMAYEWAKAARHPQEIIARFRARFVMGGHKAYQLALDAVWAHVFLHTALPDDVINAFFCRRARDPAHIASLLADVDSLAVLPQATLTLPVLSSDA
jgi:nickel-dependent lactate racemase